MTRAPRFAASLLLCALAVFQTAQADEVTVGKEGNFSIIVIKEKGRFDRCTAASSGTLNQQLRLAVNTQNVFALSFPAYPKSPMGPVKVTIDGQLYTPLLAGRNDVRAWFGLDQTLRAAIGRAKKHILIEYGHARYLYALNNDMQGLFGTLQSCVSVQQRNNR